MLKQLFTSVMLLSSLEAMSQKNFIDQPYMEVAGSADSMVTPNEIFIKVVITEKSTKDKIPLEAIEASMYKSLSGIGINVEEDLRVHDMASTFKTYLLKANSVIKSREYIVKVKDAAMAGKVFIELEKLDIGNSNIFAINHTEINNIKNLLRTKAMQNAKDRAIALTKPLGQTLGMAIHIEDNEQYQVNAASTYKYDKGSRSAYTANNVYAYRVEESLDLDFTKINLSANVKVKFILK